MVTDLTYGRDQALPVVTDLVRGKDLALSLRRRPGDNLGPSPRQLARFALPKASLIFKATECISERDEISKGSHM